MGPAIQRGIVLIIVILSVATVFLITRSDARLLKDPMKNRLKLQPGMRYILLWDRRRGRKIFHNIFQNIFQEEGNKVFKRNKCAHTNCYVVKRRDVLPSTEYDAIMLSHFSTQRWDRPKKRSQKQKMIYFTHESADYYPACDKNYDDFFNLTMTYRSDSDIAVPFFRVVDTAGAVVAPAEEVHWLPPIESRSFTPPALNSKQRAAAWFASNCKSRSKRLELVKKLQTALWSLSDDRERATIDVYGKCGKPNKNCTQGYPTNQTLECLQFLRERYYFFLSLENSFDEDYVTEKVFTAVQSDVIPIVYGGANYSRFLPPNSYLDARQYSPLQLARQMLRIMDDPNLYSSYFRWRSRYRFEEDYSFICKICEVVNNPHATLSAYQQFREWWNPKYNTRCKHHSIKRNFWNVLQKFLLKTNNK